LQKAQRAAAEASRDQKRPRTYDGKSKRTLKQCKKFQDDLAKKGYLSVFNFMAHVKETNKRKTDSRQLVARASESEQVSKESEPEELDTEALVSECMEQVRRRDLLMHWN
jgi:hypothetical protein